jgi:hypothetical protein
MANQRTRGFPIGRATFRQPGAIVAALVVGCLGFSPPLRAAQLDPDEASLGSTAAMDAGELRDVRGGFITRSGLEISFGVERSVFLNGVLHSTAVLHLTGDKTPRGAWESVPVIQNGPGNVAPLTLATPALATIIQNSLDHQKIAVKTIVDVGISNLRQQFQQIRAAALQDLMRTGLVRSIR